MNRTILKYGFDGFKPHQIQMIPKGARFRFISAERDIICAYFEVDEEKEEEERHFLLFKTGQEIPSVAKYIGSVKMSYDAFVLHLYEIPKTEVSASVINFNRMEKVVLFKAGAA